MEAVVKSKRLQMLNHKEPVTYIILMVTHNLINFERVSMFLYKDLQQSWTTKNYSRWLKNVFLR